MFVGWRINAVAYPPLDVFFEMNKLEKKGGTVMFMGSSQKVLDLIVKRAPIWWQEYGLEWLYRLIKEPKRMWRRYIVPLEHGERGVGVLKSSFNSLKDPFDFP